MVVVSSVLTPSIVVALVVWWGWDTFKHEQWLKDLRDKWRRK